MAAPRLLSSRCDRGSCCTCIGSASTLLAHLSTICGGSDSPVDSAVAPATAVAARAASAPAKAAARESPRRAGGAGERHVGAGAGGAVAADSLDGAQRAVPNCREPLPPSPAPGKVRVAAPTEANPRRGAEPAPVDEDVPEAPPRAEDEEEAAPLEGGSASVAGRLERRPTKAGETSAACSTPLLLPRPGASASAEAAAAAAAPAPRRCKAPCSRRTLVLRVPEPEAAPRPLSIARPGARRA
mmetsp:Transcript_64345/g.141836  ORF Transcript_64345/g.141836 Transcript_64345/m.141836 type:complete len:242 (-) Transcript_64345:21-746(-)